VNSVTASTRLKKLRIMEAASPNRSTGIINGEASGILNWDDIAYPSFNRIYKQLKGNFWVPEEVSLNDDQRSYQGLSAAEKHAFHFLMGLLATLDAPQSRIIFKAAEYITDPAAQSNLIFIAQQEVVHNQSYSYVLSSLMDFAGEQKVFEDARINPAIHQRNRSIMLAYDSFLEYPTPDTLLRTLVQSLILEGIHFYGAFAFFYNLAREGKMIGTSTIISYINKDELVHTKFISELIRAILGENPELHTLEFEEYINESFRNAVDGEMRLSRPILEPLPGIDVGEFEHYIQYRANKNLAMLGMDELYAGVSSNSMPWIRAYVDNFDGVKTDFFEQKVRQYSKVGADDGFGDI
jgi:ribonucleoside-diphosphate reductase beta chain